MTEIIGNHFISNSEEETEQFAYDLAKQMRPGGIVALSGEMGAGKTAFVRGFARYFGIDWVSSPTFNLINEYDMVLNIAEFTNDTQPVLFHFDLYRLSDVQDLYDIGFDDYLAREGMILIEWPEVAKEMISHCSDSVQIKIKKHKGTVREIFVAGFGE